MKNNQLEPIKRNRFFVSITIGNQEELQLLQTVKCSRIYYENNEWQTIWITFASVIGGEHIEQIILRIMEKPQDVMLFLNILDPIGNTVQRWKIYVNKLVQASFHDDGFDMEYNSNSLIHIGVRPYKCELMY
jgi:hypothetical protein